IGRLEFAGDPAREGRHVEVDTRSLGDVYLDLAGDRDHLGLAAGQAADLDPAGSRVDAGIRLRLADVDLAADVVDLEVAAGPADLDRARGGTRCHPAAPVVNANLARGAVDVDFAGDGAGQDRA